MKYILFLVLFSVTVTLYNIASLDTGIGCDMEELKRKMKERKPLYSNDYFCQRQTGIIK